MTQLKNVGSVRIKPRSAPIAGPQWCHDILPQDAETSGTSASTEFLRTGGIFQDDRLVRRAMVRAAEEAETIRRVTVQKGAVTVNEMTFAVHGGQHLPAQGLGEAVSFPREITVRTANLPGLAIYDPHAQFQNVSYVQPGELSANLTSTSTTSISNLFVIGTGTLTFAANSIPVFVVGGSDPIYDVIEAPFLGAVLGEATSPWLDLLLQEIAVTENGLPFFTRLAELRNEQKESDDSPQIAIASLRSLLSFLRSVKRIKTPSISLSPDGNVYASWREQRSVFSIHFLPNDRVNYVLFRPAPGQPEQMLRNSGTAPAQSVLNIPETSAAAWVFA